MAKKTKAVAAVPVSKPAQSVVRVGDKLTRKIMSVADYGKDDQGEFAVIEFGDELPPGDGLFVKSIDLGVELDEVDRIVLTPETNVLGEKVGREFETPTSAHEDLGYGVGNAPHAAGAVPVEALVNRVADMEMKPVQPIIVNESIHVRLTDKEKGDAARQAASLSGELADAEEQFKNESAAHKARVKEAKAKIAALNDAHNTGLQYRTVACEQHFDRERGITWLVHKGIAYRERAMTDRELSSTERSPLFDDMPDKVDPSALPSPSTMGGDELAKRLAEGEVTPAVTMPESHGGVANGVDHEVAAVMRGETKRGAKRDMTAS